MCRRTHTSTSALVALAPTRTRTHTTNRMAYSGRQTYRHPTYIIHMLSQRDWERESEIVYVHHFEAIFWVFPEGNLFIVNCIFLFYLCLTESFCLLLLFPNHCVPYAAHDATAISKQHTISSILFPDCFSNTNFILKYCGRKILRLSCLPFFHVPKKNRVMRNSHRLQCRARVFRTNMEANFLQSGNRDSVRKIALSRY